MTTDPRDAATRKRRHIDVCLHEPVEYRSVTTGFERYRLPYNALTQTSLDSVDTTCEVLGVRLRAPILIGAMTGGAELSGTINRNLATAAQRLGVGMMLGSQRVMMTDALGDAAAPSFAVRDAAPDVLLVGNIGLGQVARGASVTELRRVLEVVGADALAVHANPLQEAVQLGGDTDFSGSATRLHQIAESLGYPVVLKEVGHGIGAAAVAQLVSGEDSPLAAIDVAGAGGTSWARVEQLVHYGEIRHPALAEWGIPTAQALLEVRQALPSMPLIASGGIRTGTDAAVALALGASAVAIARPLLAPAITSADAVVEWLERFIEELRICLHGTGSHDLAALRALRLSST